MEEIDQLRQWVVSTRKIVGFTGAGISTNSGIPDFRSPGGVWAKNRTVEFAAFVRDKSERIEYWRQKIESWPAMREARPNEGHRLFVRLQEQNRLAGLITQNIDGLHEKSGLREDLLVRLHGRMQVAACLSCQAEIAMDDALARVKSGELAPECTVCGGLLKPATISFGQRLVRADLDRAAALSARCDLFLALGSSLQVQPAAGFPVLARKNGARLVIINNRSTGLDRQADLVIRGDISEVAGQLRAAL